ncbi:aldehyde dehydrogenase family protein [Streptomyces sp. NBC_00554]|uniref:aldehyde dehydrogenase family protein n=1 Tax=Streptomyces sp. NBC_00554 TaxID=2903661 RepID=UPI00352DC169|nr:aldehyde dehydrogenase family protein [Streptomyces sp. NBC_00554]
MVLSSPARLGSTLRSEHAGQCQWLSEVTPSARHRLSTTCAAGWPDERAQHGDSRSGSSRPREYRTRSGCSAECRQTTRHQPDGEAGEQDPEGSNPQRGDTQIRRADPLSSIALAGALLDAELPELPEWLVQLLPGPGETVGDQLVRHPDVRSITFTGPTAVGRHIRAVSCPARTQLELGSNSPTLLWHDAGLDHALPLIVHPAPANGRGRRP